MKHIIIKTAAILSAVSAVNAAQASTNTTSIKEVPVQVTDYRLSKIDMTFGYAAMVGGDAKEFEHSPQLPEGETVDLKDKRAKRTRYVSVGLQIPVKRICEASAIALNLDITTSGFAFRKTGAQAAIAYKRTINSWLAFDIFAGGQLTGLILGRFVAGLAVNAAVSRGIMLRAVVQGLSKNINKKKNVSNLLEWKVLVVGSQALLG
jgi:hypothetical protein